LTLTIVKKIVVVLGMVGYISPLPGNAQKNYTFYFLKQIRL